MLLPLEGKRGTEKKAAKSERTTASSRLGSGLNPVVIAPQDTERQNGQTKLKFACYRSYWFDSTDLVELSPAVRMSCTALSGPVFSGWVANGSSACAGVFLS